MPKNLRAIRLKGDYLILSVVPKDQVAAEIRYWADFWSISPDDFEDVRAMSLWPTWRFLQKIRSYWADRRADY